MIRNNGLAQWLIECDIFISLCFLFIKAYKKKEMCPTLTSEEGRSKEFACGAGRDVTTSVDDSAPSRTEDLLL